ncbi:MAG TPA: alpha/beta fold hydrolase [Mycobacteriales bacterium]|nr:alpha/beta fold hydrolase [Mycobacteriales bacterium]
MVFVFDDMELDPAVFELRRGGVRVPLEPQVFDVLAHLLAHRDRVVGKDELMDAVWGGRFVSETAVTSRIKQARRAVGDDGRSQRVIRTVHGRGYRFVAEATERDESDPARPGSAAGPASGGLAPVSGPDGSPGAGPAARIRYAVTDGLNIAYQVTGHGDRDIVLVPGFVSHLELDWADPRHEHFLNRLSASGRLIRFDKRGTGMSDRPPGVPDLETRIRDVLAVMDATGSRRAVLVGYSEGGPMATLFAATHPHRVEALVLYGAYAARTRSPDYPWAPDPEDRARYGARLAAEWSWEADMRTMAPSADDAMARWWGRRARAAATPATVRSLVAMNTLVDVRNVLSAVRVPTLVLHRRGDRDCLLEEGRYLAEHIPGARFVELPGADHFVGVDPDQILDQVEAFLSGLAAAPPPRLALAAVLAVARSDAAVVGGRPGRTAGGRAVAMFDGPATAVRAGLRHLDRHAGAALGLHVAEVPFDADVVGGHGVEQALALADSAAAGELRVSTTVRDLVAGSDLVLEPVGTVASRDVFRAVRA